MLLVIIDREDLVLLAVRIMHHHRECVHRIGKLPVCASPLRCVGCWDIRARMVQDER